MFLLALRWRGMAADKGKVLVTLRDNERFPATLWQQFRDAARLRGEPWPEALRRIIERYINETPQSPTD